MGSVHEGVARSCPRAPDVAVGHRGATRSPRMAGAETAGLVPPLLQKERLLAPSQLLSLSLTRTGPWGHAYGIVNGHTERTDHGKLIDGTDQANIFRIYLESAYGIALALKLLK